MISPAEFLSLIFVGQYDDAEALLRMEREARSSICRLPELKTALDVKIEQLGASEEAKRRSLAGTYRMATWLRDNEYWIEADAIYDEVVRLSLAMKGVFFLNDARLSRAVCLKNLGRMSEYVRAKAEVPAGTTILIDGVNWRVENL
jgi:hypothetical protein